MSKTDDINVVLITFECDFITRKRLLNDLVDLEERETR